MLSFVCAQFPGIMMWTSVVFDGICFIFSFVNHFDLCYIKSITTNYCI